MHFQSLQPLKLTFKLCKNYLETEDQPASKIVDLRTRNPTNFSLHFSDFSMIYYDFSKFQPMHYKGTLRSTIHMSHRLRRKPPGLVPILVWSPWSRFLEQRGSGSFVPARGGHPGGRGGVGSMRDTRDTSGWSR